MISHSGVLLSCFFFLSLHLHRQGEMGKSTIFLLLIVSVTYCYASLQVSVFLGKIGWNAEKSIKLFLVLMNEVEDKKGKILIMNCSLKIKIIRNTCQLRISFFFHSNKIAVKTLTKKHRPSSCSLAHSRYKTAHKHPTELLHPWYPTKFWREHLHRSCQDQRFRCRGNRQNSLTLSLWLGSTGVGSEGARNKTRVRIYTRL